MTSQNAILEQTTEYSNSNSKSKTQKETQREHLDKWIEEHVTFDPLTTTSLHYAYSHYCSFMLHQNGIPFTKKTFSILLRSQFKDKEDNYEVEFFTRSNVRIRGLKIHKKNVENIELVQKTDRNDVFTISGIPREEVTEFVQRSGGTLLVRRGKELVSI